MLARSRRLRFERLERRTLLDSTGLLPDLQLESETSADPVAIRNENLAEIPRSTNGLQMSGQHWFVGPGGIASGNGTIGNPWDLRTALLDNTNPANANFVVKAGDVIWMLPGTYVGAFQSYLAGTNDRPIIVRNYNQGRVTIDHPTGGGLDFSGGGYVWFWGLEIMSSNPQRISQESGPWPSDIPYGSGVDVRYPTGIKVINSIIHENSTGLSMWEPGVDAESNGNLVYYAGWNAPDKTHGHGFYTQNNVGTKKIIDNMVFYNANHGLQAYGSENAFIDNFDIEGNVFFANGQLFPNGNSGRNFLVGGGQGARNETITNNYIYSHASTYSSSDFMLGYGSGVENSVVRDNYVAGSLFASGPWTNVDMTGNTFYGGINSSPARDIRALYPDNVYLNSRPVGVKSFVRPNRYDLDRGNIVIYNWDLSPTVSVDASGLGLTVGDQYELHNAMNYFGDILVGTYTGGPLMVPMTGHTMAAPVGIPTPSSTFPEFGAFVLVNLRTQPNAAPFLSGTEATPLSYIKGDAPRTITSTIAVGDVDSVNLLGATVQIAGNYQNGQDLLSFANTATIAGSFDAATGKLTLSGSDTLLQYQAALRSVKYQNTSLNPNALLRSIEFKVNDGTSESTSVSRQILIKILDRPAGSIALYTFDEAAGTTVMDTSGQGHHANLVNGPMWVDAAFGKVLSFDGVNDYVGLSSPTSLDLTNESFTISARIKTSTTNDSVIVKKYNTGGSEAGYMFDIDGGTNGGRLRLQVSSGLNGGPGRRIFKDVKPINDNNWHTVSVSVDRGVSTKFYIDGVLSSNAGPDNLGNLSNDDSFGIAKTTYWYGTSFPGQMDEVVMYNRALTASEIEALSQRPAAASILTPRIFYNGATAMGGAGATAFGASATPGASFAATGGNPPANAIDHSKSPLLSGENSSFANYTNVVFGLNGLIFDIANLTGTITAADFSFATGGTLSKSGFTTLAGTALTVVAPQVTEYVGGGLGGSTRAKITFNNHSLKNVWLRVTVLANIDKGFATDAIYYFGNVVGDVNGSTSGGHYTVNAVDTSGVRADQHTSPGVIDVTNIHDLNKSGTVNAIDTSIVRSNQQTSGMVNVISGAPSFLAIDWNEMAPDVESSTGIEASNVNELQSPDSILNDLNIVGIPLALEVLEGEKSLLFGWMKSDDPDNSSDAVASFDTFFAAFGGPKTDTPR